MHWSHAQPPLLDSEVTSFAVVGGEKDKETSPVPAASRGGDETDTSVCTL